MTRTDPAEVVRQLKQRLAEVRASIAEARGLVERSRDLRGGAEESAAGS